MDFEADYLVVGRGASGMAFADTLLFAVKPDRVGRPARVSQQAGRLELAFFRGRP